MDNAVAFYSENATILKTCFTELGFETFGGGNAPYVPCGRRILAIYERRGAASDRLHFGS